MIIDTKLEKAREKHSLIYYVLYQIPLQSRPASNKKLPLQFVRKREREFAFKGNTLSTPPSIGVNVNDTPNLLLSLNKTN